MSIPPPYPRQPGSAIAVTCRGSVWTFPAGLLLLIMLPPRISINGHPVKVSWGRTVFPVPPGQYRVGGSIWYGAHYSFRERGVRPDLEVSGASCWVTAYPGALIELEYRPSLFVFAPGSLGPPPQRYRHLLLMIPSWLALFGGCLYALFGQN